MEESSKVFFTTMRTKHGESIPEKLKKLVQKAGLEQLDLDEPIDYRAVTRTRKQLARQCLKRLTDALKG